ncbi:hypothetical protein [Tropicimonas sp. IMCC34043]|uniref:hypothetical protein n=1 Tax=Tropicimonas sp. IMCC34043 TaxID=2248760 RepID=UPI000E26BE9A|nr:hypothetical protein [Tropicimonas sp. IMCC34043]
MAFFCRVSIVLLLAGTAPAAMADGVLDAIDAARSAYQGGDMQQTLEELSNAQQLVREMNTAGLSAFLPGPPSGWTRALSNESMTGRSIFGGGVGASAVYSSGDAQFGVTLMADNAVVQALAGLLGDIDSVSVGDKIMIGTQPFLEQSGELTGLVDGRIIVQAVGASVEAMRPVLERIDFAGLAQFGR